MTLVSRRLVFSMTAGCILIYGAISQATAAVSADVSVSYCAPGSPAQDLTLFVGELNIGVPLPDQYSNGTKSSVAFRTTMRGNRLLGRERVVAGPTVPGNTVLVLSNQFVGVNEATPLGTGIVVIDVTSSATGTTLLGQCTFNLTVTRQPTLKDVIGIPLRPCFLEGTTLSFDVEHDKFVPPGHLASGVDLIPLIDRMNDQVWLKQARIAFRTAQSPGVPVIKDPRPPSSSLDVLGGVELPGFGSLVEGTEGAMVKVACDQAWQKIDPSQKGTPVVFIRRFEGGGGTLGVVNGPASELIQRHSRLPAGSSTRLCQQPRQLQTGDLTNVAWTLLLEPEAPIPTNNLATTLNTLAHELGHTLLLGHGNGLDDDANGKLPPEPGPRRYDDYCDPMDLLPDTRPKEDALTPFLSCEETESLMHPISMGCEKLRPLQIEQARAAAKLTPGSAFEASTDPAGAFVSELTDPLSTGIPTDVLLASVELAETPALAITQIAHTIMGSFHETGNNRYTTFLDLDSDPTTGCTPSGLGFPTEFRGAELLTSVTLETTSGQPSKVTPTVWHCEAGGFVESSALGVQASVSDSELLDTARKGRFLGRIEVLMPSSLAGPHADRVRVQGIAEQLGTDGKMNRLPPLQDAGGLIFLSAPVLPRCSVSAPVVNPGSITRVKAHGLPSGQAADLLLGGELAGTGRADSTGQADIELSVPSTSRMGLRPITVQVRDALSNATCEVEVVGQAVTPMTSAVVAPVANAAGWNNSPVTVTLTATSEGTTVSSLSFSATGAQVIPEQTVAGGSAVVPINAEGETTLTYFATDSAGSVEPPARLVIRIDRTPPSIVAERTPPPNSAGWNSSSVTVTFHCADALSGVTSCSDPIVVATEGANQSVAGSSTDRAGNLSSITVPAINIDKTPPTMTCAVTPESLWPPNHRLVTVTASVAVEDSLSGRAGFLLTSVTSNDLDTSRVNGNLPDDIQGFVIRTPDTIGQLRAERSGGGGGRLYTLSYAGRDVAGNAAQCVARVAVPHDRRGP